MPLYEFDCADCGRPFEELVRSTDKIYEVSCPKCGSRTVKRKVSTFASKVSGGGSSFSSAAADCAPGGT